MKKFLAVTLAASLAGSAAFAGGPVVVEVEQPVAVAPAPSSGANWVVPAIGILLVCAVACGGNGT